MYACFSLEINCVLTSNDSFQPSVAPEDVLLAIVDGHCTPGPPGHSIVELGGDCRLDSSFGCKHVERISTETG